LSNGTGQEDEVEEREDLEVINGDEWESLGEDSET